MFKNNLKLLVAFFKRKRLIKKARLDAKSILNIITRYKCYLPSNASKVADIFGIKVQIVSLSDEILAVLRKRKGEDTVIFLNGITFDKERRFLCALLLGHYVYRLNYCLHGIEEDKLFNYEFLYRNEDLNELLRNFEKTDYIINNRDKVYAFFFAIQLLVL